MATSSPLDALAVALAACAAALVTQGAAAQALTNAHRVLAPRAAAANPAAARAAHARDDVPAPEHMVPLLSVMVQAFPTIGANADGSDLWPCYGHTNPNTDCPTIGNPQVQMPLGSLVVGKPAFSWALQNDDIFGFGLGNGIGCDAFVNGTTGLPYTQYKPCAQISTFFEDDTNDTDDDLLQRIVVTQGTKVIYDTGTVDFGPAGPINYPVDVQLYYDVNFGYWPGAEHGPNNGNCTPDIAYPLAAPAFPNVIYQVAGGSTCVRPQPGRAHVWTETVLATPSYHQVTGTRCTSHGVASPCYVTSWDRKHHITQQWDVFLR